MSEQACELTAPVDSLLDDTPIEVGKAQLETLAYAADVARYVQLLNRPLVGLGQPNSNSQRGYRELQTGLRHC